MAPNPPRLLRPPARFQVRQSRAGLLGFEASEGPTWAETTPDSGAVRVLFAGPIKAAPLARNIPQQSWPTPATLAMAQALVSSQLLVS